MNDTSNHTERRLDTIEKKIDKLSEVLIDMARTEEKVLTIIKNQEEIKKKHDELQERLDDIASHVQDHKQTLGSYSKIFIVVQGAIITYLLNSFFNLI